MKRLAAAALTVLLLWALVPAVGEFVEIAVHFAQEGHSAHAMAEGDQHDPLDSEHGCTGTVHLCQCCVSLSVLLTHSIVIDPLQDSAQFAALVPTDHPARSSDSVYHPPRA